MFPTINNLMVSLEYGNHEYKIRYMEFHFMFLAAISFHRLCQLQSTSRMIWRLETKMSDLISSLFTATLEHLKKGQAVRQAVRNTDRQPNRQAVRQTHRGHTDRQTHFMIVLQVCWLSHNFDSNWFDLGDEKYYLPELNFSFHFNFYLFIRPSNWKNGRFVYALFV